MKRRTWWFAVGCIGCALALAPVSFGQEKKDDAKKPQEPAKKTDAKADTKAQEKGKDQAAPGMDEEMMKKWQEYATPGAHHKHLEPLVGKWTYELKWWDAPDAEPQPSAGTAEFKWIMDGRYLQQETAGPPMGGEAPFKGLGLYAYDNMEKQYSCIWIDNLGTGMMYGKGTCTDNGKTISFKGEFPNLMTGDMNQKYRSVMKVDKDKHSYEMFLTGKDGKEFRCMEIQYTRAK
jgi:hypothetical protein